MQTKHCSGCQDYISITRFGFIDATIRGIGYKCKKCSKETVDKWKQKQGIKSYIYTISCPITKNVVYVGKTKTYNPLVRAGKHFSQYKTGTSVIENWNYEMVSMNKKPIFEVIDIVPDDEVLYWEVFYINLLRSWGFKLLNTIHNKT